MPSSTYLCFNAFPTTALFEKFACKWIQYGGADGSLRSKLQCGGIAVLIQTLQAGSPLCQASLRSPVNCSCFLCPTKEPVTETWNSRFVPRKMRFAIQFLISMECVFEASKMSPYGWLELRFIWMFHVLRNVNWTLLYLLCTYHLRCQIWLCTT